MRFEESQITDLFHSLSAEDRDDLIKRLRKVFHSELSLSPEELAAMPMEKLLPLRDTIRGYVLTKKHVPNILEAYAAMDTGKLPSKISFGRIPKTTDDED